MVKVSGKIRRLLLDAGLVSSDDWGAARDSGQAPVDWLIAKGALEEGAYYRALAMAAGVAPVDLTRVKPDPRAVEVLPRESCIEHTVLPLARVGETLTVAVSDPFDVLLLDDLNMVTGHKVRPVVSRPAALRAAIEATFEGAKQKLEDLLDEVGDSATGLEEVAEQDDDLTGVATADDAPAVKLVNHLLERALKDKASDIHIEPCDKDVSVRLRIDGRLIEVLRPPKRILPALVSRLKILAHLDIAERFAPQDGKFQTRYQGRTIDFRLSTLPVVGGEKAVMRILDSAGGAPTFQKLGYEPKCLEDMEKAVNSSYGMVLVTGPTGSGKSTTLYAAVRQVATPEINVVTVEDPVEYRMDGINQVPVNPKRGMTFAGALRSILRQDPDVILVGEIRDLETAEIAIKAALTGHLVLSTLHTNDAAGAVTRLGDMGIDPFMVSSSLICVAAQRLARILCPHCREAIDIPPEKLRAIGFLASELDAKPQLYTARQDGCPRCTGGYKGRFAILETLFLDAKIKRMIVEGKSVHEIKTDAISQGMLTLRRVGILNVIRGKTSLEEVLRVTMGD
ncbi:MAG TPA: GspE/PulE family protein [Planctomycetota bacterium]|nr:GspE/PulE family protein [Planctomycetota bacterium]